MTQTSISKIIKDNLEMARPSFDQLNLNGLSFFKEMEYATQRLLENSYLAGAHPESIRNSLVNVAMIGLTLSPVMKMAYLVPRKLKLNGVSTLCCVLEPSYVGLCKILTDTGSVMGISATIVYEKEVDSLVIKQGINGYATHKPYVGFDKPGKPIACYSKALLSNGVEHVELLRSWEWEDIQKRSESVKSYNQKKEKGEYAQTPTWLTDLEEMIRKTAIKKHYKYLPKTEKAEEAAKVIDLDNQANGIDFTQEQSASSVKTNAAATPNEPEEALATEEDLNSLIEWLDHADLPDTIFGTVKKAGMKAQVNKKYVAGQLTKSKAEAYIKGLQEEVAKLQEAK